MDVNVIFIISIPPISGLHIKSQKGRNNIRVSIEYKSFSCKHNNKCNSLNDVINLCRVFSIVLFKLFDVENIDVLVLRPVTRSTANTL